MEGINNPKVQPGKRYILAKKFDDDKLVVQYVFSKERPVKWNSNETIDNTGAIVKIKGTVHASK